MANFIVAVDPDNERRTRFVDSIRPLIAPVEGLTIGDCGTSDFSALWALLPDAPFSRSVDDHGVAVIWGEAIVSSGSRRQDATGLRQLWRGPATRLPPYDGFHSAVVYAPEAGLCATADLLGLFPLYYYYNTGVLLIGSSPELMRWHPSFKRELSSAGLIGLLLTNALKSARSA